MDFALTDEQKAIIATTRAFVERELYPHEEEVERTGRLRPELAQAIAAKAIKAGLYAANMPEEVGGAGLDTVTWVLYEKELGRAGYALHSAVGRPSNILLGGQRGPEGEVPLPERARRAPRLPRADRAGRRVRPARHAHQGGSGQRRMADQGHQALHQPRRRGRLRDPLRAHRPGRRGLCQVHVQLPGGPRHPGRHGPRRLPERLAPRLHQLDPGLRLLGARRGAARRGGQGPGPRRHLVGLAPVCRSRPAAWAARNGRSTSPYATPPSGSSSARRSAASRASPSSSPTWPSS